MMLKTKHTIKTIKPITSTKFIKVYILLFYYDNDFKNFNLRNVCFRDNMARNSEYGLTKIWTFQLGQFSAMKI